MRFLLYCLLVLLTFLSCYAEEMYTIFKPPLQQERVYITFRAQDAFNFDQEKAFGSKRNLAVSQYTPLYTYLPERAESAKKKIQELIAKVSSLQPDMDANEFAKRLRKEFGVDVSPEEAARLLQYADLKNLLEALLTIEESILQTKIVEDPQPLKGKMTADVLYPDPVGAIAYPVGEFITQEDARRSLREKARQVFWEADRNLLNSIVQLFLSTITPNLKYDQKENNRRIEEIIRRYPSKIIPYKAGAVLVPFGKVLSEEDVLLLGAHHEEEKGIVSGSAPWMFSAIFLVIIFYHLLLSRVLEPWQRKRPPYNLLLSALIVTILLMDAILLLTPVSIYALPMAFLPLLIIPLNPERISATWTVALGAFLVSLFSGRSFEMLLYYGFGAVASILFAPVIRKRAQIFIPAMATAVMNVIVIAHFSIDWNVILAGLKNLPQTALISPGDLFINGLVRKMAWAVAGGISAGPLALLLLPVLETMWNTASTFKLNQYTDLQQPILRGLLTKAPGTYQHTMTVAYLAEAVGEAVGANTLLLRTGAYFHDIGKTLAPACFVENLAGNNSPHDAMTPLESAQAIINHVNLGKPLCMDAGIPEIICDFIPQHHGTIRVEFFYNKACNAAQGNAVREEDFRYAGPKPQSVEAAILMICDAVEAASRTLPEPNAENIRAMIWHIVKSRLTDGQFEECGLSTRDIAVIVQVLTESLAASFHTRVAYPWQQKGKGKEADD